MEGELGGMRWTGEGTNVVSLIVEVTFVQEVGDGGGDEVGVLSGGEGGEEEEEEREEGRGEEEHRSLSFGF